MHKEIQNRIPHVADLGDESVAQAEKLLVKCEQLQEEKQQAQDAADVVEESAAQAALPSVDVEMALAPSQDQLVIEDSCMDVWQVGQLQRLEAAYYASVIGSSRMRLLWGGYTNPIHTQSYMGVGSPVKCIF